MFSMQTTTRVPFSPPPPASQRALPTASPNRATSMARFRTPEPIPPVAPVPLPPATELVPVDQNVGSPYAFNPTTGMLETPGARTSGAVETSARFVEGGPGGFRRVPDDAVEFNASWSARRAAAVAAMANRGTDDGTMRSAVFAAQSVLSACGLFAQGLLAGVAMMNLFMTYFLDAPNLSPITGESGFLHYYSPIAVICQRVYITLSSISLIAAVDKYSRDALSGFMLQGFALQKVDFLGALSFFLTFLLSVIAVPFEDRLHYSNARVPGWWATTTATSAFVSELSNFHGVNAARATFALVGYFCVCSTATPGILDVVARAEELTKGSPGGAGSRGGGGRDTAARGDSQTNRDRFGGVARARVQKQALPTTTPTRKPTFETRPPRS